MKKSTKILLYGSIISTLYIILCIFIQKDAFISRAENLISENRIEKSKIDNTQNSNLPSKEIETIEEINPPQKDNTNQDRKDNLIDTNITISTDIEDKNLEQNITKSDTNSSNNITTDIEQNNIEDDIEIAQNKITEILKKKKINFYRNRAKLTPQSKRTLKEIIAIIKDIPNIKIDVRGYTDASGKKSVNKWISEARAKSVKLYLGSHGINPDIIDYKGLGEDNLLYKNKPYSHLNRRVEIEIKRR